MQTLLVVKIGGNIIDDPAALRRFLQRFAELRTPRVLVHGGGKIATRLGERLGLQARYVNGRRITDDETIDLVTMVYGGLVNKQLVALLQSFGSNAIGLTGADGNLLPARKRPAADIDFGWVGDLPPGSCNADMLNNLLQAGVVPVCAPLTHDGQGHMLNTNADTIASAIAVGMCTRYHVRLIYCFEKKGVLANVDDDNSVITSLNRQGYEQLKAENRLFAGILPKIDNAFAAIEQGVPEVLIGHADDLLLNTGSQTRGTLVTA